MALPDAVSDLPKMYSASSAADLKFPESFLWGVSTAAHQVEGGNNNNQWTVWEAEGRTKSREVSGRACDWWSNAERDLDIAQKMGLNALRLSVEWSRVEPRPGEWDQAALRRYREILQGLRSRGIQPIISLHHFTHPQWFEKAGSFLGGDSDRFERFAIRVVSEFGDLCRFWVTFNEPNVFAALGYVLGEFPPGQTGKILTALKIIDGMAVAHGRVYPAIHRIQPEAQVGWAHNYVVFEPARSLFLDRWTASLLNRLFNESFLASIERGQSSIPLALGGSDLREVMGTCDFVGVNVYSRFHVAFSLRHGSQLFSNVYVPEDVPQGDRGVDKPYGEAYPGAVRIAAERCERLGKPIYVLENGVPDAEDRIRPWLLVNVIRELNRMIREGKDIRGYFHWTLTDNFEWSEGWRLRFGLVELDGVTQQRKMRPSGRIYGAIARSNGIPIEINRAFPED